MKSVLVVAALAFSTSALSLSYSTPKGNILWEVNKCQNDKCATPTSVIIGSVLSEYLNELPSQADTFEEKLEADLASAHEIRSLVYTEDHGTNLETVYQRIAARIEKHVEEKRKLKEKVMTQDHPVFKEIRGLQLSFAAVENAISKTELYEPKKALLETQAKMTADLMDSIVRAPRDEFEDALDYLRGEAGEFWFVNSEVIKEFKKVGERCYPGDFALNGGSETLSLKDDKKIVAKFINGPKAKRLSIECPHYPVGTPLAIMKASYSPGVNLIRQPWKYDRLLTFDPSGVAASSWADILKIIRKKIK